MKKIFLVMVSLLILISTGCRKEYRIEVKSGYEPFGTVAGSGNFAKGTILEIAAIPSDGCEFLKWDDGNTSNPRSINVEGNATYTAIFVVNIHTGIACIDALAEDMIKVQGGTFKMGAASDDNDALEDEKPQHSVTISDFYICKYEVTQELWQALMDSAESCWRWQTGKGTEYPAYGISGNDCDTFIQRLNAITGLKFRLPTEAEWEYAARGGNKSRSCRYAGGNEIGNVAWYTRNSDDKSHPVMRKNANELGIYDMAGNVFELCSDWYDAKYYAQSKAVNPQGPSSGIYRVCRGGCWCFGDNSCRVSGRFYIFPEGANEIGFRLVL
ncbi:MAG: SUMF1/EgtB/PvdO family nonheme iron enzyme [Bacteroidales bacterium]|nr:SUMF1/EgtB/PvdO family nonheme iron enzyme [Bacteroidales bacterium]